MKAIKLSSKTLVHISSGLYRSTANALKELVSNSFDADATLVEINTNFPRFDALTCRDNGQGMTEAEFKRLMEGGIGNSKKRTAAGSETTPSGRPVIGRIGIGMLAIAQICVQFKVISHHQKSKTAFEAVVNLKPYRRDEIDSEEVIADGDYEIGSYDCKPIPYDKTKHGVLITTKDLRPTYTKRYRDDVERDGFKKVPLKFANFLRTVRSVRAVRELGDYWLLFWELCVSCPVPYTQDGPIRTDVIVTSAGQDPKPESTSAAGRAGETAAELSESLAGYDFTVKLDGTVLRKIAVLPVKAEEKVESRAFKIDFDGPVEGHALKYEGYIYLQTKMIKPADMRGVIIRVRNVAIGEYDLTCLNYEKVQGFRRDWISGEIYVELGLEDALNIDRHSFNEVSPHYMKLQKHLHQVLTEQVFPAALRASEISAAKREKAGRGTGDTLFLVGVQSVTNTKYTIARSDKKSHRDLPVIIDSTKRKIKLYQHSMWPKSRASRAIAERIVMAFVLAGLHADGPDEIGETAFKILKKAGSK